MLQFHGTSSVGSIVGVSEGYYGIKITECYAKNVTIKGLNSSDSCAGGLIGYSYRSSNAITKSYFSGTISGTYNSARTGTLQGDVGGSSSSASFSNSYYNSSIINSNIVKNGTGKTTTQFGNLSNLSGFSSSTWQIVNGYPELKIFIK